MNAQIVNCIACCVLVIGVAIAFCWLIFRKPGGTDSNYLYDKGDKFFIYDIESDSVKELIVRHRISGWSADNWECYNCITTDGGEVFEPYQRDVCKTYEEARKVQIAYHKRQIKRCNDEVAARKTRIEGLVLKG